MKIKVKLRYMTILICVLLMGCSQNSNKNIEQDIKEQGSTTEESSTVIENEVVENEVEENALEENALEENALEENALEDIILEENILEENTTETPPSSDTTIQQTSDNLNNQEQEVTEDTNHMESKIVVYKSQRRLELWQNGELTNEYHIGLGKKPEGKKEQEGDKMTPEGEYYVCTKNQYSKFYLALGVSYPNIEDAKNGLDKGLINEETYNTIETAISNGLCPPWNTALGGEIMIHGHGGSEDWTKGCIAVDDEVMDILWDVCPIGTKIVINP